VEVSLGPDLAESISAGMNAPDLCAVLDPQFDALRLKLFNDVGIILPKVKVRSDLSLGREEFRIRLNDLLLLPEAGRDAAEWIVGRCERAIRNRAEIFLTSYCLDNLRASSPHLAEAICQRMGVPMLLGVLEGLLEEGLSIRDLRGICESLLAIRSTTRIDQSRFIIFFPPISDLCPVSEEKPVEMLDRVDFLNCARMAMKAQISSRYAKAKSLTVYLVDPPIEEWVKRTDESAVSEDERRRLLSAVCEELKYLPAASGPIPILTTMEVRRKLWRLLERELGRYPVLAYNELSPDMNITPIARIAWS
jgi:type III secretory pathway component EscV